MLSPYCSHAGMADKLCTIVMDVTYLSPPALGRVVWVHTGT